MFVYCVFQRVQLTVYHYEFVLQKVFANEEAANNFCDNQPDTHNWCWEGHFVD